MRVEKADVFNLYREAREFLDLEIDEAIDWTHWVNTDDACELIAKLAEALSASWPEADCDTDNEFRREAERHWGADADAELRGAFILGANHGFQVAMRFAPHEREGS